MPALSTDQRLTLNSLTKTFPGQFEATLKAINLTFEPGEFCILIGSNGSGKSTLLRCISGEYSLDKGQILLGEQDVTNSDRSAFIASVTQDPNKGTIPEMTLLENLVLSQLRGRSAKLRFYRSKKQTEKMKRLLEKLDQNLESFLYQPVRTLSGGQRQMLATLMAIESHPHFLLLDEHTSALDPANQHQLMEYTAEAVKREKMTTLMITHHLDDAVRYGNRLLMLHKGRIVLDLKGEEKKALVTDKLLSLFHSYEDLGLKSENVD